MLDREGFEKLQTLARLRLEGEEAERLKTQLEQILAYMRRLDELDLAGVPPMTHPHTAFAPLRADEPLPCLSQGEALAAAPDQRDGLLRVPRVLRGDES